MNYIQLSDKGASLYKATYQTMLDRVSENGFAQTSLTGAYPGMFVRDASIQVMAHIAEGDYEYAKRILQYMVAYHRALKAEYAVHVMNGLVKKNTTILMEMFCPVRQSAEKLRRSGRCQKSRMTSILFLRRYPCALRGMQQNTTRLRHRFIKAGCWWMK